MMLIGLLFGASGLGAYAFRRAVQRHDAQVALHAPLLDRYAARAVASRLLTRA